MTYIFKDLEQVAAYFEEKAKKAERVASNAGPQIKQRHQFEAAAYYDVVNVLRNAKVGS